MKTRSSLRTLAFASLVALAAPACAPHFSVVRYARPNPLLGTPRIAFAGFDFTGTRVGDEPEPMYLARKTPQQQASYMADRAEMTGNFVTHLARHMGGASLQVGPPTDPAMLVLHVRVLSLEPGVFTGFYNRPTVVHLLAQITTSQGVVLDEITSTSAIMADMYNPSSGGRFRSAGLQLGDYVGEYLERRMRNEIASAASRRTTL